MGFHHSFLCCKYFRYLDPRRVIEGNCNTEYRCTCLHLLYQLLLRTNTIQNDTINQLNSYLLQSIHQSVQTLVHFSLDHVSSIHNSLQSYGSNKQLLKHKRRIQHQDTCLRRYRRSHSSNIQYDNLC
jgi:hypothetical protein